MANTATAPVQMRQPYPASVVYRNVMIPMRDGVRLATDIYLPSADHIRPARGHFAVLLSRTPYSKQRQGIDGRATAQDQALRASLRGFAVAIQDTRGRYESEGQFRSMTAKTAVTRWPGWVARFGAAAASACTEFRIGRRRR